MKTQSSSELLKQRDQRVCWHPYTQHASVGPPLSIRAARGSKLILEDGREIIDGISSWWTVLHGHGHPQLLEAMNQQASTLDHVLFAGATHEAAVGLAEELLAVAPSGLQRVFYSDNGSTAVEVALKMALQGFRNIGDKSRRIFIAFKDSYHGDTFGAMSVSDPDPFFEAYEAHTFQVCRIAVDAEAADKALRQLGNQAAGIIIEPMVQGAGGMKFQDPEFLRALRSLCDDHKVPLIADEVMTGFGRTGKLFACDHAGISPDLMCLAKGLTGGIFPLSATLATAEIFDRFWSDDRSRMLFHGHSFTAHPVGCAVARSSLAICLAEDTPAKLEAIGAKIASVLRTSIQDLGHEHSVRQLGGIVATNLSEGGYFRGSPLDLGAKALEMGVLLRTLGPVLYAMPTAATSMSEAETIGEVLGELLSMSIS
ncbi:MAG: adenosylmethionine--8-amino-7-oxononanoate transaminase [Planctomycetota bacterium]